MAKRKASAPKRVTMPPATRAHVGALEAFAAINTRWDDKKRLRARTRVATKTGGTSDGE